VDDLAKFKKALGADGGLADSIYNYLRCNFRSVYFAVVYKYSLIQLLVRILEAVAELITPWVISVGPSVFLFGKYWPFKEL